MNIIKVVNELEGKLNQYNFEIHPDLVTDLAKLFYNTGNRKDFLSKFVKNLDFLNKYGIEAHIQPSSQFELLKEVPNMYSMHVKGKSFNIRILYSFFSDNTILLHGFYKRGGKQHTDYSKAIPIAKGRFNEYIETLGGTQNGEKHQE